ncbi:hypothetical protein [Microcoleus sp. K5-D4]|uniref:hypothetical protein n=1 Tax=Microcoleus sp. K5-D4 TaxID=2818801 RepID=UPI002FD4AA26
MTIANSFRDDRTGFGINQEFALAPPRSKTVIESSLFPLSALLFCPRTVRRCRFGLSPGGRSS